MWCGQFWPSWRARTMRVTLFSTSVVEESSDRNLLRYLENHNLLQIQREDLQKIRIRRTLVERLDTRLYIMSLLYSSLFQNWSMTTCRIFSDFCLLQGDQKVLTYHSHWWPIKLYFKGHPSDVWIFPAWILRYSSDIHRFPVWYVVKVPNLFTHSLISIIHPFELAVLVLTVYLQHCVNVENFVAKSNNCIERVIEKNVFESTVYNLYALSRGGSRIPCRRGRWPSRGR